MKRTLIIGVVCANAVYLGWSMHGSYPQRVPRFADGSDADEALGNATSTDTSPQAALPVVASQPDPESWCLNYGIANESQGPEGVCSMVYQRLGLADNLTEGVTMVVPSYKGLNTMRNTVESWKDSHLLRHPLLREVVVRMNGCTCSDYTVMAQLWEPMRHPPYNISVRILCGKTNWLFARVMLALLLEVRTELFFQTEADRPTLQRSDETIEEYRKRVAGIVTAASSTALNRETPYVHMHRMIFSQRDLNMYRRWQVSGGVKPIELTRPHQQPNDITQCWHHCEDRIDELLVARENGTVKELDDRCMALQRSTSHRTECERNSCRELSLWRSNDTRGMGAGSQDDKKHRNLMCYPSFLRRMNETHPELAESPNEHWFLKYRAVKWQLEPFLTCFRSSQWANAPAIYNTHFYFHSVAVRMCHSPRKMFQAGLIFNKKKRYYNHYGKRMEYFLRQYLAGHVVCHTDGITEHIELESYEGTHVGRSNAGR
eukprot:TRINITY_DN17697_c0_g1_i3.p2 TRINITY_DN17697_c0_g1~~TRINITY_DN17697_c0_g1_i3.p2  ORF type:complete len:488 (+),score=142.27 TRINITY_DN17697_c0_g1_i3:118-1581(+)